MVVAVEYDEVAVVADEVIDFAAQDAHATAVKRAHHHTAHAAAHQLFDAFAHFAGRLVGEGDGHDMPGRDAEFGDKVSDTVGQDAGFAAAGAGKDENGAGFG